MSQYIVPPMDLPSISFSWFLDAMRIEDKGDAGSDLQMVCVTCETVVCDVEDGDTLRVLMVTGLAHKCEPTG